MDAYGRQINLFQTERAENGMTTKAYLFKCDIDELVSIFANRMPMCPTTHHLTNVSPFGANGHFQTHTHNRTPLAKCDNGILNLAG